MNHDTARAQVLAGHLGSTLNTAVAAQSDALVLQAQLQSAQDELALWKRTCLNLLTPEDYARIEAAVKSAGPE